MTDVKENESMYVSEAGSMEERIRASLMETSDDVAHSECFDAEQRAEVYTILETLRTNAITHRAVVELLSQKLRKEEASA